MNTYEQLGKACGYALGLLTASISYARRSRMFHPKGLLVEVEVSDATNTFPPFAMARLSSGWWKEKEWPDALGIALRFSEEPITGVHPKARDQDLLLVSFSSPLQLPIAPLLTRFKNFMSNDYFGVAPFEFRDEVVKFKLAPKRRVQRSGTRREKFLQDMSSGTAEFTLYKKALQAESWEPVADLKFGDVLNLDQEALRFFPFHAGLGIRPRGFLQYLRIGTYQLSQWARPISGIPPLML